MPDYTERAEEFVKLARRRITVPNAGLSREVIDEALVRHLRKEFEDVAQPGPAMRAAVAIQQLTGYSSQGDTPSVVQIARIIETHLPSKPGVAYMPVPRCGQCRHWEQRDGHTDVNGNRHGVGRCVRAGADEPMEAAGHNASVRTLDSFGCVLWESM